MKRFLSLLFGITLSVAQPAQADDALWLATIAQGPVSGKLVTWLEVQPRFTAPSDTLIVRPALGVQINPATQLLLGYALVDTYPQTGARRREHRIWQQALLRLAGKPGKAVLMSRTRLEQRFVEDIGGDGWRLRQFLRGQYWLNEDWSGIAVSEVFLPLNDTRWGQRAGLEQVRNFIGVGRRLGPRFNLEAGYLNQRLVRPGADSTNHVLNINLFYRLG